MRGAESSGSGASGRGLAFAFRELTVACTDPERFARFYRDVLGAAVIPTDNGIGWRLRLGSLEINLMPNAGERSPAGRGRTRRPTGCRGRHGVTTFTEPEATMITMPTPVVCPDLGAPGVVCHWHAKPGDAVTEGERLVEVLIPGALVDIPAPADGTLVARRAEVRDRVAVGDILGELSTG